MSIYQSLIRNVLYPVDRWRTGDAAELKYLREFERSQFFSSEELQELALRKLQRLLAHAYESSPLYKERFDSVDVKPQDIRTFEDLSAIPILDKRDIQSHRDEMIARTWPRNDLIRDQTGGSTGAPISYYYSRDRKCSRAAAAWRHNRWAGWDIGDKVALVWGVPPLGGGDSWKKRLRNLWIDRRLFLNTGCITEHGLRTFVDALKRFRPKVILAYARSMALLARYVKDNRLLAYQPSSIITSAEVLSKPDRALIEEVFGCPVYNRYGCREVSVIGSECSEHNGLHIMNEGLHVEVVRGTRPVEPGEVGAVLVTDLLNHAMPLIRYRIGDMASRDDRPCACGRGLSRLRSIEGRVTDFLLGDDGRLVSGVYLATYVLAQRPSLGQVHISQNEPDCVIFTISRSERQDLSPDDYHFLESETKRYLGDGMRVECQASIDLSTAHSGKFLFCRSTVASNYVENNAQL